MPEERHSNFAWCCALTTLVSALLLFLVQPIISKLILPWYGGSPAVWTTCLLFFQTLLLAGYAYAHLLVSYLSLGWQMRVHGALVLLAAITLPITPSAAWEPLPSADPVSSILLLLSFSIGLPFFALSATGPLVQSWFGNVYPGVPPYRLYALSNIGSLASLWLFPLLLEPNLTSTQQDWVWSTGFGLYLLSIFVIAVVFERQATSADKIIYPEKQSIGERPRWYDMALWIGLPALASVLLAAITSHICQDMAVVPPLLILPLSLYLLTFILAFDSPHWYIRPLWGALAVLSLVGVSVLMMDDATQSWIEYLAKQVGHDSIKFDITDYTENAEFQIAIFMLALFSIAMICHGETTRRKPHTQHLTLFYLMISAGGALGSALVAIVCPLIFRRYDELGIALVLGFLVAAAVIITAIQYSQIKPLVKYTISGVAALLLSGGLALLLSAQVRSLKTEYDTQMRNFYGVASVRTYKNSDGKPYGRVLYNGQINHGFQFLDGPRRYVPNSYYAPGSGVHLAFDSLRNSPQPLKVGVIGLGTGTLAANGQKGDEFRFYEIDEKIIKICDEYFTYLKDTPAKVDVVLGDARLSLAHELKHGESQQFDILVIDAFSGDAIPVHLLTLESMKLYAQHMSQRGVIAVHVSNRHLDLIPVVMKLADEMGAKAVLIENGGGDGADEASSDWVLVTNNPEVVDYGPIALNGTVLEFKGGDFKPDQQQVLRGLSKPNRDKLLAMDAATRAEFFKLKSADRGEFLSKRPKAYNVYADGPLWTDKFSNVWSVLK